MLPKRFCPLFLTALLPCNAVAESEGPASRRPNIVLILADDLGYGDLGVTGSKQISTPHIDLLAAEGVRFTNAYVASAVCAPSRAGLMTGKHPVTFGFRDNLAPVQPGHDPEFVGLPLNQTTLAERLKKLGYTTGIIGKWHLGELPKFSPLQRGFDEFWGYSGGAHDYFRAEADGEKAMAGPILCSYKQPAPLTYLTDDQGNESVDFIRRHKDHPFFLFASFAAPHSPMQATEEDLKRFASIKDKLRRTYCAMVYRLDQNVGKILDELRAQGVERDTLVVFLSDNGGPSAPGLSNGSVNAPLRGSKTTVLEGGIRVPMIVRWPATLPSGKTMDAMVSSLDLLPTFVTAAGGLTAPSEGLVGVNLLPLLSGKSDQPPHESLMWTYTVGSAIRSGDWKLIRLPDRLPMLYHLSTDLTEQKDLALEQMDRTRAMLRELGQWELRAANPVCREPADWRVRHLKYYDSDYQTSQPEAVPASEGNK
ncbi:MAG: sulfatase [Verrucomicrobiales bacterium VVV1]|nr:MAG: sulfatase [Verrucomicrobiales bacterium VVV1]